MKPSEAVPPARGDIWAEREQWRALTTEPRLDMLPTEALVASIHYLAERLLEMTEPR